VNDSFENAFCVRSTDKITFSNKHYTTANPID
jgi:hypothetical protein